MRMYSKRPQCLAFCQGEAVRTAYAKAILSSVTNVHPTHMANPIEPIFGTEVTQLTLDNRDHVLDGVWIPQREG